MTKPFSYSYRMNKRGGYTDWFILKHNRLFASSMYFMPDDIIFLPKIKSTNEVYVKQYIEDYIRGLENA